MRRPCTALLLAAAAMGCGGGGGSSGGGAWHAYASPGTQGVTAVWAFAPDDVWAGSQIMLHFDGSAFRAVATPPIGFVADFLGFAPDDLYAVSGQSLLHWDGAAWSAVSFGGAVDPTDLQAIWGTSRDDLWLGDSLNGAVHHFDGATWETTISQTVEVTDLWGAGPGAGAGGAIYAAGIFGMSRWGGSAWSSIGDTVVTEAAGLWGFAADDVWAAGDFATLAHWDGTAWTDRFPAGDDRFLDSHASLWGSAPDDVWAVGEAGAISHWDGARWTQVQYGTFPYFPRLNKVHGSSASDVWVVGLSSDGKNTGVILHRQP